MKSEINTIPAVGKTSYAVSARKKSGRAWNGAVRDAGIITHAVPNAAYPSWTPALCGTKPGVRGGGWQGPEKQGTEITCAKCRKKLER